MSDQSDIRRQAVAAILRGVTVKTASIIAAAAAAAAVFSLLRGERWWFLPASVLFGGALGLMNFRWLALAVQRVYLRQGATTGLSQFAAAIISVLKLSVIFVVLFVVIKWQLVQVFGLVAGLSVCFLAIIWEGAVMMKSTLKHDQP